jgi:acetyl esterase/lipase
VDAVDIYVGDENDGGPIVVLLHGYGSSGAGGPDDYLGPLSEEIAGLGSTVFYFGWQTTSGYSAGSAADLSCVRPFVAARAAECGADPDKVIMVGHSVGAELASMLAFSLFDLAPSPDCTETGQTSSSAAFAGIGGSYGVVGGPRPHEIPGPPEPVGTFEKFDADEEVKPGLIAAQLHQLDRYRAIPPVDELDIVLVVRTQDQYSVTVASVTARLAESLQAENVAVEVVTVEGANHDDIVDPTTEEGQATLQVLNDILSNTG